MPNQSSIQVIFVRLIRNSTNQRQKVELYFRVKALITGKMSVEIHVDLARFDSWQLSLTAENYVLNKFSPYQFLAELGIAFLGSRECSVNK